MISIQETARAMGELVREGTPNGKVAFWAACLSTRNRLERNCRQAEVMRSYANRPLPTNRDELKRQLGGAILGRTINSLYEIEHLWNKGIIHFNTGDTYAEQARWRASMVAAIPGMGMKTVSFALHIYNPTGCRLLTIDCWHTRRMNWQYGPISDRNYTRYEQQLFVDIDALAREEGYGYAPIVYAACLWERARQQHTGNFCDEYPSHAGLSCYV
jgi:hypothetical protein